MVLGEGEVREVEVSEFSELWEGYLVLVELDGVLEAVEHMHEAEEVRAGWEKSL